MECPNCADRDTVELWRLPHQRKISLRFLAYYLLKMEIQVPFSLLSAALLSHVLLLVSPGHLYWLQGDLHDSIEDSWTALLLYQHYLAVKAKGYKHFHGEVVYWVFKWCCV